MHWLHQDRTAGSSAAPTPAPLLHLALRCLLVVGVSSAALPGATALPRLEAIVPDGDLADWGNRGARLPFLKPDSTRLPDPARSNASARFAWDALGLLVAVDVTDTTPNEAAIASAAYTADSVELFLAANPAQTASVQLIISPGRDPAHPVPRHYIFHNGVGDSTSPDAEPMWAVKRRADGYVVEARLPWAALHLAPAAGLTVGTRLYVNDKDGDGGRTRFVWAPETGAPFHAFTLADDAAAGTLDAAVAWAALDVHDLSERLNLIAPAAQAGRSWQVRQGERTLGEIALSAAGDAASGTLLLPPERGTSALILIGPDHASTLTVPDTTVAESAALIQRASSGRVGTAEKSLLMFARADFSQHIFTARTFPALDFIEPGRVAHLLGQAPAIVTQWLDADGRDVTQPDAPGRYAARSTITLPGKTQPVILESILYRMPEGSGLPPSTDETTARIYAFALQGGDATPSQSARVAERWWYGVRRARGWSEALPYKIHVPQGEASTPRALIVHLHGSGQHSELAVKERLPLLASLAGPDPIIVYPQSPNGWRGPPVGELIDALSKRYPIDPARIYLIGFSLGGMGAWEVALDQPERFAAVVAIGGRMGSPADAPRLKDVPVWVFNGQDDPTTTVQEAGLMVDALKRAGGHVQFTVLPGRSHGDSQDAAYRYPGLFEWMLAQRRDPSR